MISKLFRTYKPLIRSGCGFFVRARPSTIHRTLLSRRWMTGFAMADPTTQSNYLSIATKHVEFDWSLDFVNNIISGSALHTLKVQKDGVKEVVFDTSDLDISSAYVDGNLVDFELGSQHPVMGSALRIPFSTSPSPSTDVAVKIMYKTSPGSNALQWLKKEQTQGKQFPYLFSQCQPIYARSIAPLQDTPSVKLTYSAKVTSTLPVLMSAVRLSPPSTGPAHDGKVIGKDTVTYVYRQSVGIPSYLIAIAAGNVRYRAFDKIEGRDWSSGVWAEPEFIDAAHWEFREDTGKFLSTEEDIVLPYRFGVYDLLVLPPSFPYGGMENSCLTFLTPTLLAGDRTLVDVVVHELTHSWFGNGVTHCHASHFWLNEGWTTYMERVLLQFLYSPAERGFSYLIGYKSLKDALKLYESQPKYQRLVIDFAIGEDPDDAYSTIPYEKGSNFILHLERKLGGLEAFLPYVRDYVKIFMGKSISTTEWKDHLYTYWRKHGGDEKIKILDSVDWNGWLFGEGLELPVKMEYDTSLAEAAYSLAERWNVARDYTDISKLDFKSSDLDNFNSNQKAVFLERLQSYPALPPTHLRLMGELYSFDTTNNTEIRYRFYELALLDSSSPEAKAFALATTKWVVGDDGSGVVKGRMKYCRPLFRAVYRADSDLAQRTFKQFKPAFHPIAARLIEKDIGLYQTSEIVEHVAMCSN